VDDFIDTSLSDKLTIY